MSRVAGLFLFVLFFAVIGLSGQTGRFRVMAWNVENLFDTCHDAGFDDREFLPQSERKWNGPRYWRKLKMVSRTIAAVGETSPPELVALCEVENDSVLTHLTRRGLLRRLGYDYVMTSGHDPRGIDVALLYQPLRFRLLADSSVSLSDGSGKHPLRDALHVVGLVPSLDTLDVFVCHLPSQSGGGSSHFYRRYAARRLREYIDSVITVRRIPRVMVLGDFNEEERGPILSRELGVRVPDSKEEMKDPKSLYLISGQLRARSGARGTYKFQGEWLQLDHVIVSGALLQPSCRFYCEPSSCKIAVFPFLVRPDETRGGVRPWRTWQGPYYAGGTSDHLPLFVDFYLRD